MNFSLNKSIDFLLLVCIAILPFSNALINIGFGILIFLIIINAIKNKQINKITTPVLLFTLFTLYLMINGLFQGTYQANKALWKLMPILFLGNLILRFYKLKSTNHLIKTSIISCFTYVIICLFKAIVFYYNNGYLPFGNGNEIDQILIIHRPYLGFYIVINLILLLDFIKSQSKNTFKTVNIFIFVFLSFFLILIAARLSILTLIILGSIYISFYTKFSLKKKIFGCTSIFLFISFFTFINPNIKDRIKPESIKEFVDYEPRFIIWKSVKYIYNNEDFNKVIGYGNYNLIEEYLVLNYTQNIDNLSKREFYISERFNTHSQFLDYLLFGGYVGLILFLIYIFYILITNRKKFTPFALIFAYFLFMIVENTFHRQFGVYIFLFYIILFLHSFKSHSYRQETS